MVYSSGITQGGPIRQRAIILAVAIFWFSFPPFTSAAGLGGGEFSPTQVQETIEVGNAIYGTISWNNTSTSSQQFLIHREDLAVNDQGQLIVVPFKTTEQSLGDTFTVNPTIQTLATSDMLTVTYLITIPDDYPVGDHFLALVFDLSSSAFPAHKVAIPFWIRVAPAGSTTETEDDDTDDEVGDDSSTEDGSSDNPSSSAPALSLPKATTSPSATSNPTSSSSDTEPSQDTSTIVGPITTTSSSNPSPEATNAPPKETIQNTTYPDLPTIINAWKLNQLRGPAFAIFQPRIHLEFENTGNTLISPSSIIRYLDGRKNLITSGSVTAPLLLPGTQRTVEQTIPDLAIDTPLGHLPYIGSLRMIAVDQLGNELALETFVAPWWVLFLAILALLSLISRILSFHHRAPHRHLVVRYQGRVSLGVLVAIVGLVMLTAQGLWSPTVLAARSRSRQTIRILPVTGYRLEETATALIVQLQANSLITIIVDGQVYEINSGDGPLSLPKGKEILIMSPFGA